MNGFGQYVATHWNYTGGWSDNKFHGSGTFHFDLGTTSLNLYGKWNHGTLEDEAVHIMTNTKANRTATIYGSYSNERLHGLVKINVEKTKSISSTNTTSPGQQAKGRSSKEAEHKGEEGMLRNQTFDTAADETKKQKADKEPLKEPATVTVTDYRCNSTVAFVDDLPKGQGVIDCEGLPASIEFTASFEKGSYIHGTFVLQDNTEFACIVGKCLSSSHGRGDAALTRAKTVFEALSDFADFRSTLSKGSFNTVDWSKSGARRANGTDSKSRGQQEL